MKIYKIASKYLYHGTSVAGKADRILMIRALDIMIPALEELQFKVRNRHAVQPSVNPSHSEMENQTQNNPAKAEESLPSGVV